MARASIWLKKFDRDADFVVNRPFRLNGVDLSPGRPFDKSTVSTRTLRQLYDCRKLRVSDGSGRRLRAPLNLKQPPIPRTPMAAGPGAALTNSSSAAAGEITARHTGRGKFFVFVGEDRVAGPFDKAGAEAARDAEIAARSPA